MIPRSTLAELARGNPRLLRALEEQAAAVDAATDGLATTATATAQLEQATVLTLSTNDVLQNERVLVLGRGLKGTDNGAELKLETSDTIPTINGGFKLFFTISGDTVLKAPLTGQLATTGNIETLTNKTLAVPKLTGLGNYADDAAAAAGGVPVTGMYRNGSVLMVRVA